MPFTQQGRGQSSPPQSWEAPAWRQRPWSQKLGRRLFHMAVGSLFPVLAFFLARDTLLMALGSTTAMALCLELARLRWAPLNHVFFRYLPLALKESEASTVTGATYLLIGSVLAFVVFDRAIAVAALLFLSIGDPLAGMVGERFGRHRLFGRSLEGSLACLAGGILTALLLWLAHLELSLPTMMAGVVMATLTELAPLPVNDNLSIPLFSGGIMTLVTLTGI